MVHYLPIMRQRIGGKHGQKAGVATAFPDQPDAVHHFLIGSASGTERAVLVMNRLRPIQRGRDADFIFLQVGEDIIGKQRQVRHQGEAHLFPGLRSFFPGCDNGMPYRLQIQQRFAALKLNCHRRNRALKNIIDDLVRHRPLEILTGAVHRLGGRMTITTGKVAPAGGDYNM